MIKLNPIRIFLQDIWNHPAVIKASIIFGVVLLLLETYFLFR